MELTHFSLFTGIGGLDIAAEWAGFKTVGQCEYADYPTKVLEKHWPDVPRWRDIRDVTKESFKERTGLQTATIISGGFPCQPFSVAGKRKGKDDDRYLWPEMLRVISEIRPAWVIGENVAGIVNMALDTVLSDMEAQGYETQAYLIPACSVDAPHRRNRIFIVGHDSNTDCNGFDASNKRESGSKRTSLGTTGAPRMFGRVDGRRPDSGAGQIERAGVVKRSGEKRKRTHFLENAGGGGFSEQNVCGQQQGRAETIGTSEDVADARRESEGEQVGRGNEKRAYDQSGGRCEMVADTDNTKTTRQRTDRGEIHAKPESKRLNICSSKGWWAAEPDVGRVAHGIPSRVDRLKCLGNAVVPQQAYPIFKAIGDIERTG